MKAGSEDITAVTAVCNTRSLIERMYIAFRSFHPDMKLIILDNSDIGNHCQGYLDSISSTKTIIYRFFKNTGHARALNFGIGKVETKYALLMDSDTVMLKSPINEMLALMKRNTYGVGWVTEIGRDGYDFGTWAHQKGPVKYLHPYFCLVNIEEFRKFPPFIHHGNPFTRTMIHLNDLGLSNRLICFKGLTGHTNGKGSNWTGAPSEYIRHDFGGTRQELRKSGRKEIEGSWEY